MLTVSQYADLMQVSRRTVLRWIDGNQIVWHDLAPTSSTRRIIRIPENALPAKSSSKPQIKESVMLPRAKKSHLKKD